MEVSFLKDAIDRVVELAKPFTLETHGGHQFCSATLREVKPNVESPERYSVDTLEALVKLIRTEGIKHSPKLYVRVDSARRVMVDTTYTHRDYAEYSRLPLYEAVTDVPSISINQSISQERAVVELQSLYAVTPDRDYLLSLLSRIDVNQGVSSVDNGISQEVSVRTGAVLKEQLKPSTRRIVSVAIMPCTAKKSEAALPTMRDACGDPDVDVVLTTREIVRMFRGEQINPAVLDEMPFDSPLGSGTGAAVIFGATGGVMDAALRSAYYLVTGQNPDPDAFRDVRGMDGWKEAKFDIPGAGPVSVAVASGLLNTRKLMTALERGEVRYDFVEIMACPGGCAGGGGQPIHDGVELAEKRGSVLWNIDKAAPSRFSHENPEVHELYREFMKKPLSDVSHHLLHTDHQAWKMPSQK